MFPLWTLLILALCYLLGSLPSGQVVARRMKGIDLRQHGSGNTGASNALRALGPKGGAVVLLLDLLKGFLAVQLAMFGLVPAFLAPVLRVLCGLAAIAGHNWSVFMGFRGGKGVATTFGVLFALSPKVAVMAGILWVALVALTRYSSVGSLGAAVAIPVLMIVYGDHPVYVAFGLVAAAFSLWRHRGNIKRLLAGEELVLGRREEEER